MKNSTVLDRVYLLTCLTSWAIMLTYERLLTMVNAHNSIAYFKDQYPRLKPSEEIMASPYFNTNIGFGEVHPGFTDLMNVLSTSSFIVLLLTIGLLLWLLPNKIKSRSLAGVIYSISLFVLSYYSASYIGRYS
jgi:hypothetical protein